MLTDTNVEITYVFVFRFIILKKYFSEINISTHSEFVSISGRKYTPSSVINQYVTLVSYVIAYADGRRLSICQK